MFFVSENQKAFFQEWAKKQDAIVATHQDAACPYRDNKGMADYGAAGGAYTWSFTPTGIVTVIEVTNTLTKETVDLTPY